MSVNDGNSFPKKCMALASAPRIIYFLRLISFLSSLSVILSGSEHTFLISFADFLSVCFCARKIAVSEKPGQTSATYTFLFSNARIFVKLASALLDDE